MSNRQNENKVSLEVALNRSKALEALISGKHKQQKYRAGKWWVDDAPVCFYGLMARVLPGWHTEGRKVMLLYEVLGIASDDVSYLVAANDAGVTFPELAIMLEEMFNNT